MTTDEKAIIDRFAQDAAEAAEDNFREGLAFLAEHCASPIERVLLAALILIFTDPAIKLLKPRNGSALPYTSLICGDAGPYDASYVGGIYPQVDIGPYRADFYFEAFDKESGERWFQMIIECDGHVFHEKTKEQARRDKKRDRWFQSRGIIVLRFTGSEVWGDPYECASEVEGAFFAAYKRRKGRA